MVQFLWKIDNFLNRYTPTYGAYGGCVSNCLRSCLFSREVAPFYVAIAMILNTGTLILGFPSPWLLYSRALGLRDIALRETGVTAILSLKTMRKHLNRVLHSTQVITPIVQKVKDSFLNYRRVLVVDPTRHVLFPLLLYFSASDRCISPCLMRR